MIRIQRGHRGDDCKIWQNGQRTLKKWWNAHQHPLEESAKILQNHLLQTLFHQTNKKREALLLVHTFPRIEIVRFASVRKQPELVGHANPKNPQTYTHTPRDHYSHHNVLDEQGESRNDKKYAIVVQDLLASQWIQSYPCKTKASQETAKKSSEFSRTRRKPKMIHTSNSLDFGKDGEDLRWNHRKSALHRLETKWNCRKSSDCSVDSMNGGEQKLWNGKPPHERRFEEQFGGPVIPFGPKDEHHPIMRRGSISSERKYCYQACSWAVLFMRREGWTRCRH